MFGGHVRAVFSLITIIFIICVIYTVTSFSEIPLRFLNDASYINMQEIQAQKTDDDNGRTLSSIPEETGVPTPTQTVNCVQEQTNYGSTGNLEDEPAKVLYCIILINR